MQSLVAGFRLFVKWNGTDGGAAVSSSCWNKRKFRMDKRKKGVWSLFTDHVEWWQNYLTEISVLVVGLGLTYWADAQWDRMEQEVQDGELLQMVAEELDANLTEMEHMEEYYRKEIDFTVWLARELDRPGSVPPDSAAVFMNQHRLHYYWFLKQNAFRLLRETGAMQRLDKGLLAELFACYELMEVTTDMGSAYRERRLLQLTHFMERLPGGRHADTALGQWRQIAHDGEFCRYLRVSLPMLARSALGITGAAHKAADELLRKIENRHRPDGG